MYQLNPFFLLFYCLGWTSKTSLNVIQPLDEDLLILTPVVTTDSALNRTMQSNAEPFRLPGDTQTAPPYWWRVLRLCAAFRLCRTRNYPLSLKWFTMHLQVLILSWKEINLKCYSTKLYAVKVHLHYSNNQISMEESLFKSDLLK